MIFDSESVFEENVITVLKQHGWKDGVLRYPTERDLLDNWKGILYRNNNDIDRLGKYPLTDGEMTQIIEQIETLRTPLALNSFVNGRTVSITRDNKEDVAHFGKEVSLYIYDRKEIAGGKSTYQIAQQPVYPAKNKMLNSRRGDLVLLINGMPLIHIELKKSGIPVSQATNQIEKYAHEGVFTGLFRLVQIFVAMNPDDAVYFANPGVDKFNPSYYFHWADYNNNPEAPYELDGYLTEINTGLIDTDYMNANFNKWLKALKENSPELAEMSAQLHRSFAALSRDEQRLAELFLHDVERGDVEVEAGMTLRDYITRYAAREKNEQVDKLVDRLGVNRSVVEEFLAKRIDEANINEFGRFDALRSSLDVQRAKAFFEQHDHKALPVFKVRMRATNMLKRFVLMGGFDIDDTDNTDGQSETKNEH